MDIHYGVRPEKIGKREENPPGRVLRREEAHSLKQAPAGQRVALQEAISLIRLGMSDHLRVLEEEHLPDDVTRAVACAEVLSVGGKVTVGDRVIAADDNPLTLAWEAARERHRLLPPVTGAEAYISRGWPSDEDRARLAHKLMVEMHYPKAEIARILKMNRQGIDRILWEWDGGSKYPRYWYREFSGADSRRPGRSHLPGKGFDLIAVLGDEYAETSSESHLVPLPFDSLTLLMSQIVESGTVHTLSVTNPDTVFITETQRRVVYDLALFRGVHVVEDGKPISDVDTNPRYSRLLREGTELFVALSIRDQAAVVEESRSIDHARKIAAELRGRGCSLRVIAAELYAEAIPTESSRGVWSASAVRELLKR